MSNILFLALEWIKCACVRAKVVNMAEGDCVGCDIIRKYDCLKCGKFAGNRGFNCSLPASEDYPGWKECKKVASYSRCDKEGNSSDYLEEEKSSNKNLQGSIKTTKRSWNIR